MREVVLTRQLSEFGAFQRRGAARAGHAYPTTRSGSNLARMSSSTVTAALVAHDGSEFAHRAVDAVAQLFAGRRVIVLSVWESATTLAPPRALAAPAGADAYARVDKAAEEVAASIAERRRRAPAQRRARRDRAHPRKHASQGARG